MRRHPWLVVSLLAVVGVVLLGAFPTRAYLDQVNQREQLADRARVLRATNEALAAQASQLETDEAIERLARERYQLVRPGEEAYAILPDGSEGRSAAQPTATASDPLVSQAGPQPGFWSRAWTRVTSIF
jgi:cell division protein FtsB